MNPEEGLADTRPIHTDAVAAIQPYIGLFACRVIELTPQDDWYQPWCAYTLAVLLRADALREKTAQAYNQAYSDGLNTARVQQGKETREYNQFSYGQWQLFKRVVFGGIEDTAGKQLTIDIKPDVLLAGIVAGTYRHRPLLGAHSPS